MILIAILAGIILGQYIRLDVNPKAIDFARAAWTFFTTEAPAIIGKTHDHFLLNKLNAAFPAAESAPTTADKVTVKPVQSIAAKTAKQSEKLTVKAE
jgi:hypothetical protein